MPEFTRRWSDERNGLRGATIVYDAVGYTTMEQAKASGPFQFNSQYPHNSAFKCDNIDISAAGFRSYRAAYSFTEPEGGTDHPPDGTGNPTAAKPRISWRNGNTTEETDVDADGLPILNSAGEPFDPPLTKYFGTLFLRITRWENAPFNVSARLAFQNKVNSDSINFQGLTIGPGKMLCLFIQPTSEYTQSDLFCEVAYDFELRDDGFKSRRPDLGFRSWVAGEGALPTHLSEIYAGMGTNTAQFVGPQPIGHQVSQPVLLDGTGKPINPAYKGIRGTNYATLLQNPNPPTNFTIDSTTHAKFLRHKLYKEVAFSGLGLN